MKDKITEHIEKLEQQCNADHWFPDDDSMRSGYLFALEELKNWIQKL